MTIPATETNQSQFIREALEAENHAEVLKLTVLHRRNILLAGCTGSGKTTLANTIMHTISELTPNDRVIILEDVTEMQCSVLNHVQLKVLNESPQTTWKNMARAALKLSPTRIVFGDIRDEDSAQALIDVWTSGPNGGIASIHANDAVSALRQLESFAGHNRAHLIASCVHVSLWIDLEPSLPAGRAVRQIIGVTGYDNQTQTYKFEEL
jgi:type IV secretion system protein TrbB